MGERHSLLRTSPKGEAFVGVCVKCGREGLTLADMASEECPQCSRRIGGASADGSAGQGQTDMTTTLAPCPFCGSNNVDPQAVLGERGDGTPFSNPGCLDCDATTRSVEAWNTRKPSDERDNQIAGLLAVLRKHHQWHDNFRSYYVKTVDDEFVEIDNADAYADSDLASETTDALWLRFRQPTDTGFAAGVAVLTASVDDLLHYYNNSLMAGPGDNPRREVQLLRAVKKARETLSNLSPQPEELERPVNCREAGPGKGLCVECANGNYEKCLYLKPQPEDKGLREALELVLPLAKGYAHAHPVGSNAEYVRFAEEMLATQEKQG